MSDVGARVGIWGRREAQRARDGLSRDVGVLVVKATSQLLGREVDAKAHAQLLDQLANDIARG